MKQPTPTKARQTTSEHQYEQVTILVTENMTKKRRKMYHLVLNNVLVHTTVFK